MTITFGTSFQENLRRVYSNTGSNKTTDSKSAAQSRSFNEILTQLNEKTETKPTTIVPEPPPISNLTVKETKEAKAGVPIPEQTPSPEIMAALFNSTSVKSDAAAVNNLTPVVFKQTPESPLAAEKEKAPFAVPPIILPNGFPAAAGFSEAALKEMLDKIKVPAVKSTAQTAQPDNAKPQQTSATGWDVDTLKQMITAAGQKHGVDPLLGIAVARAESALKTNAVSSDGFNSKGMFQILDSTAKTLLEDHNLDEEYDPFNPHHSSHLGMGYLRKLHDIFSRPTDVTSSLTSVPAKTAADLEKLAVAAFNTGEGNVTRAQMVAQQFGKDPAEFDAVKKYLPKTTQAYVERVMQYKKNA